MTVLCTGFPPISDVNEADGVAELRYLKVDCAAISLSSLSFNDIPSLITFPLPNPKSL